MGAGQVAKLITARLIWSERSHGWQLAWLPVRKQDDKHVNANGRDFS